VCSCSTPGECETTEHNVLEIFSGIPTEAECSQACEDFIGCTNYTYLGEKNPLRFVCFLLSSCDNDGDQPCYSDNNDSNNNDNDKSWTKIADTRSTRIFHSSAQHEDRILLIGGWVSSSTEWISTNGGESQIGPWTVRHGLAHCTIQVFSDLIVVTGGGDTYDYVTEYQLTGDATETEMTSLINGRFGHACGAYREAGGQQVLLVTGGAVDSFNYLSSTEVAVYSAAPRLSGGRWRAESFHHQGTVYEPPWSETSSMYLEARTEATSSPRCSRGTQLGKPGKRLATWLWRGTTTPLWLYLRRF